MGWVIELRKPNIRVPTPWLWREGNIGGSDNRERKPDPAESENPAPLRFKHEKQHAREPGDFSGVPRYRGPVLVLTIFFSSHMLRNGESCTVERSAQKGIAN